jgi:hypothetical protein
MSFTKRKILYYQKHIQNILNIFRLIYIKKELDIFIADLDKML